MSGSRQRKVDNSFDIRPVCCWEDDDIQLYDPDYEGGAKVMSLNEARKNFIKFKAKDEKFILE